MRNRSPVKMGAMAAHKKLFFSLRRLKGVLDELGEGDLHPESITRIAKELGVTKAEVIDMNSRVPAHDHSLAAPVGADGDRQCGDRLGSEDENQDDAVVEASEFAWRRSLLANGMSGLNDRERHIFSERRLSDEPKTLKDLSQVYGVSRERVRQIEARAFEKVLAAMLRLAAKTAGRALVPVS